MFLHFLKEGVVPYQYSTSNRNYGVDDLLGGNVVPYQYSTSNRNCDITVCLAQLVVPYQYSTSNRNNNIMIREQIELFLISILHQTATVVEIQYFILLLFLISILHQTATSPHHG